MRVWLWAILAVFMAGMGRPLPPSALPNAYPVATPQTYHATVSTQKQAVISRQQAETVNEESLAARRLPVLHIAANHHRYHTDTDKDTGLYVLFPPARGQPETNAVALRHAERAAKLILLCLASAPSVPRAPPIA